MNPFTPSAMKIRHFRGTVTLIERIVRSRTEKTP